MPPSLWELYNENAETNLYILVRFIDHLFGRYNAINLWIYLSIYIKKIYDNLGKAHKIIRNEDLYSSEYLFDVMSSYQIQEQQEDFKF